uniref:Uncharacterized protein n=1 Tax=Heterorhabditis bacteriophora TaxID=37862 RepID=A0A1I7XD70_HETBA
MKKAKKRKSFDNIETANGNNLNLEGNYEGDNIIEASPCIKLRIPRPPSCTEIHNIPSPSPPHSRSTSPSDFSLKLTKKGNKYTSAVVEKSSPIVNGVQLAHMFAYRSSSGRTPRPSKWLDHAAGEEIKRKTLELEAAGMMNKPREPITYDAEMERAIAEEEKEFMKETAKKKRRGSKKAIHSVDLGISDDIASN